MNSTLTLFVASTVLAQIPIVKDQCTLYGSSPAALDCSACISETFEGGFNFTAFPGQNFSCEANTSKCYNSKAVCELREDKDCG